MAPTITLNINKLWRKFNVTPKQLYVYVRSIEINPIQKIIKVFLLYSVNNRFLSVSSAFSAFIKNYFCYPG